LPYKFWSYKGGVHSIILNNRFLRGVMKEKFIEYGIAYDFISWFAGN